VDHLPLEVRALDHVAVDDPDCADARGREVLDDRRAEPAGADHERASVEEALFALRADLVHDHVSGVPVELVSVERETHG